MINYSSNQILNISIDLDRIATSIHRGSFEVAHRFSQEILKQEKVSEDQSLPKYIKEVLDNLPRTLSQKDLKKKADDALMYSILLQNFVTKISRP